MRLIKEECGQTLVVTALNLSLLLACVALAVDVGLVFRERRRVQNAADAAATAAALDYHYNHSVSSAQAAGRAASASNYYTNNASCPSSSLTCVQVNMPPLSGPNTAYTAFAEAIVNSPQATSLMGMFGFSSMTVAARAVAGNPAAGQGCMYITGQGPGTLKMKGAYAIEGSSTCTAGQPQSCGIYVDSTDAAAVKVTGNGGCVNANFFDVAGGYSGHMTSPTPITTGVGNVAGDPFLKQVSTVPQPSNNNCTAGTNSFTSLATVSAVTSITTTNVASVSATSSKPIVCFTNAVTIGNGVNLPGFSSGTTSATYIFMNGVTIGVGSTVKFGDGGYDSTSNTFTWTSGATMELYGGTLTQDSNSLLSIYAPTNQPAQGTTNGIAIWQPPANTNALQVQFGSNNETLDGFIYAPGADVTMHDNGGGVSATGLVALTMTLNSSSLTLPNYNTANQATTPLTQILLVE